MRDYQVINPIKHNGAIVRSGTVALSDADGAVLMQQGFVAITGDALAQETTDAADPPLAPDNESGGTTDISADAAAAPAITHAPPASETLVTDGVDTVEAGEAGGGESPAAARTPDVGKSAKVKKSR